MDALGYSYCLDDVKKYYELYQNMMNIWRADFGERIIEVDYEKLVEDPELRIRLRLSQLSLEFQQSCLSPERNNAQLKLHHNNK